MLFGLLVKPDLVDPMERLAHIGFMFGGTTEFSSEIQRRDIKTEQIKIYPAGQRQAFDFEPEAKFVEWEISCHAPTS